MILNFLTVKVRSQFYEWSPKGDSTVQIQECVHKAEYSFRLIQVRTLYV